MYITKKLLRRPRPFKDESLSGYIIRLAQSNYYPSPSWIFKMSSLKKRGIYANLFYSHEDDLQKLSLLSEVEEHILWSMAWISPRQSNSTFMNTVKIFGDFVPIQSISKKRVKLCPICLRSAPYCRSVWELSFIKHCPLHNCLLIDSCPQCSKKIVDSRPGVTICKCGFDWRNYEPETVSEKQVSLSKFVYNLCRIADFDSEIINSYKNPNPVLKLNFQDFAYLLCSIVKFGNLYQIKKRFSNRAKSLFHSQDSESCFNFAFFVALNWRSEFQKLVLSHKNCLDSKYKGSFIKKHNSQYYVNLFRDIFRCFPKSSCGFITNVIEDYFWNFLVKTSIKNVEISGIKQPGFHFFNSPVNEGKSFLKKLAVDLELEELTVASLFATSQVEIYNRTIFFKMTYLMDVSNCIFTGCY
ncbi:TniQ family protein [Mastigocoleus sp. MO_188.B34]|uniref:TniQ family protein n=1 Tax=Mastigocoleus sp. MO_188.B34 TaxID=3036635 RepID=UPI00261C5398|nr:TniQ family protein [Mastigocoleus sp. MO_188.B34]MDJ0697898.1 TniQ family protein [Mastigocoleus sp. MO_188.B34]